MKEEYYDIGTEIISSNEPCTSIMFVVQGHIELQVYNQFGETYVLDTLGQGDVLGMYSILFNEAFLYTAVAAKNVRLLTIDQQFFLENQDDIAGLQEAIIKAEKHVEHFGVPMCDFKKYNRN